MENKKKDWKRLGNFFCTSDDEPSNRSAAPEHDIKRKVSSEENQPAQIHRRDKKNEKGKMKTPLFITEPGLQYSDSKDQTPVDLVIGLDIGTAWTKVVIQDVSRRRAIAIPFNEYGSKDNRFLLPTRVGVSGGYLNLCEVAPNLTGHSSPWE